jgi:hypothetical protein
LKGILVEERGQSVPLRRITLDTWVIVSFPDQVIEVSWIEREVDTGALPAMARFAEPGTGTVLPTWRLELNLAELQPFMLPHDTLVARHKLDLP